MSLSDTFKDARHALRALPAWEQTAESAAEPLNALIRLAGRLLPAEL